MSKLNNRPLACSSSLPFWKLFTQNTVPKHRLSSWFPQSLHHHLLLNWIIELIKSQLAVRSVIKMACFTIYRKSMQKWRSTFKGFCWNLLSMRLPTSIHWHDLWRYALGSGWYTYHRGLEISNARSLLSLNTYNPIMNVTHSGNKLNLVLNLPSKGKWK